jgi:N-acetylmuramoyl-L-alanine amidase
MSKKIAIVVGHTKAMKGACSPHGIACEWVYNSKVASYLKDIADIYYYDTYSKGGYTDMVKRNARKINAQNYNLVMELHYNDAAPEANGCETYYYFSNAIGKQLATTASEYISSAMGVKNRGIRALINKYDRGFAAVYYPTPTTLLLEPFFGSNEADCKKFMGKEKEYADVLRRIMMLV